MELTAEQIQSNWEKFIGYINTYISDPRKDQLLKFYKKHEEEIMLMPASHKKAYHNAFPGGYVDHVNRVIEGALEINKVWYNFGAEQNYTIEELVFSAINHDLGKMEKKITMHINPQLMNGEKRIWVKCISLIIQLLICQFLNDPLNF